MLDLMGSNGGMARGTPQSRLASWPMALGALALVACGAVGYRLIDRGVSSEPLESSMMRIDALLLSRESDGDALGAHCANVFERSGSGIELLARVAASNNPEAEKARKLLVALKGRLERAVGALPAAKEREDAEDQLRPR